MIKPTSHITAHNADRMTIRLIRGSESALSASLANHPALIALLVVEVVGGVGVGVGVVVVVGG